MMIPPLSEDALDANPSFARLWKYLTEEILEEDGSRKTLNQERRTKEWRGELVERRKRTGENHDERERADSTGEPLGSKPETSAVEGDDEDEEAETPLGYRDDGGTKKGKKETLSLEETLHETRVEKMRIRVLTDVLRDVAYSDITSVRGPDSGPGSETDTTTQNDVTTHAPLSRSTNANAGVNTTALKDNLLVVTAYMDTLLLHGSRSNLVGDKKIPVPSQVEQDLLIEDMEVFEENIPIIAKLVGRRLVEVDHGLGEMIGLSIVHDSHTTTKDRHQRHQHPQTNLTKPTATTTTLVEGLRLNHDRLTFLRSSLLASFSTLSEALTRLMSSQRDQLADEIRTLEVTKHGIVSRHAQSRTAFFVTVARAMDLKLRLLLLEGRKGEQNSGVTIAKRAAAREKMSRIENEDAEVSARIAELERLVKEYDAVDDEQHSLTGGGGVMTRLGKRYGEIEKEMELVKVDIDKLQQRKQQPNMKRR